MSMGIKGTKEYAIVQDSLVTLIKHDLYQKKWRDGKLDGNALFTELQDDIERLKENVKVFDDEQVDKSGFRLKYPFMVKTGQEQIGKMIATLQKNLDELKQKIPHPQQKRGEKRGIKIKFLLGAPYPRSKPTGYYGRACTPFQGGRKNWNTSCHGMTRSAVFLQPQQAAGY